MTINQLIHQYKQYKVCAALVNNKDNIIATLYALDKAIVQGAPTNMHGHEEVQWQKELREIDDIYIAMLAFYEMALRNFNKRATSKLAFYYATKVILSNKYPQDTVINAYCIRSIVIYNNIDDFLDTAKWAKDIYYKGRLDNTQFFDLFLLANVYCGWINTLGSNLFESIKVQAVAVANNHPSIGKDDVTRLGIEASNAVYDLIAHSLKNSSFPIMPSGCC